MNGKSVSTRRRRSRRTRTENGSNDVLAQGRSTENGRQKTGRVRTRPVFRPDDIAIDDATVIAIAANRKLRAFSVSRTQITDGAMACLILLPLEEISIDDTVVTDAGMH